MMVGVSRDHIQAGMWYTKAAKKASKYLILYTWLPAWCLGWDISKGTIKHSLNRLSVGESTTQYFGKVKQHINDHLFLLEPDIYAILDKDQMVHTPQAYNYPLLINHANED